MIVPTYSAQSVNATKADKRPRKDCDANQNQQPQENIQKETPLKYAGFFESLGSRRQGQDGKVLYATGGPSILTDGPRNNRMTTPSVVAKRDKACGI
jgi:hypothetical protein